ncbi:MAG: hypothetical protein GKR90_03840 [Pseudomonadales bacterium]|nr:hypothetical protein [Pseudomonadales bacterium]
MAERIYCSELAREASAPMHGSAVHVDIWLLLEYPRPWKPKALIDNDLPGSVVEQLSALPATLAGQGIKLRVQFIKQASSADQEQPRGFIADGRGGAVRLVEGTFPNYAAFAEISTADILAGTLPNARVCEDELLLVCTNGQRDLCCARFGLPLFENLAFTFGHRVWQTTHVGGHRYAPNLVCLPSGIVYGQVEADTGEEIVSRHDSGEVVLENLRGRSGLTPAGQAAEYFVRLELENRTGPISLKESAVQNGIVRFMWQNGKSHGIVDVRSTELGMVLASCGAEPKLEHSYELDEFKIHEEGAKK